MLNVNYHTHMKYCNHAEGDVSDYVKKAIELNFLELGMSDHAPVLKEFMTEKEYKHNYGYDNMPLELVDDYLNQIEECKRKYKEIKLYSGFETEFLEERIEYYKELRSKVDYLNLGIHFFKDKNGHVLNCYEDINFNNLEEYLLNARNALKSGLYTTFVHPDIFMFGYKDKNGNHVFDEKCEYITREIAKLAIEYDVYLEVNANGLKYCDNKNDRNTWLYPYPKFWEIIKEYPVKILIGLDAHSPSALNNDNVKLTLDFVKDLDLKIESRMVIK